jgi:hypothetical protein
MSSPKNSLSKSEPQFSLHNGTTTGVAAPLEGGRRQEP